jgi:hypothetical protein
VVVPSTTTTTLPEGCSGFTPGTLDHVRCRLDVLDATIAASPGLGSFQAKLAANVDRAIELANEVDAACTSGDTKTAAKRMKQVLKQLDKVAHRLRSNAARKQIDEQLRLDVLDLTVSIASEVDAIRTDPCD